MEILELVLRLRPPRRMTAPPLTPTRGWGVEPCSASPGRFGAPSPSGPPVPPAGPAGCGACGRYSPGVVDGRRGCHLARGGWARRAGGAERGRRGAGRPRGSKRAAGAGPGATAALLRRPLRLHTKDGAGGRRSALSRRPAARAPRLCRLRPLPGLLLRPQPLSHAGAPGRRPRAGPQHRETWGGGADPGVGAAPSGPRRCPGSSWRCAPPRSPGPSLPRSTPIPGVPDTARRGAVLARGRAREGGGRPLRFRGKMERNKAPSAAHLACRRRAARLPGPRLLRSPAPPRPRARRTAAEGTQRAPDLEIVQDSP